MTEYLRELRDGEAGGDEILADGNHRLHLAGVDVRRKTRELLRRQRGDESGDERTAHVGIAVGRNKEAVALPHAADQRGGNLERVGEPLREVLLLDAAAAGADDGDGTGLEQFTGAGQRGGRDGSSALDRRGGEAVVGLDLLVKDAAGIGEPGVVHRVVAARGDAVEHALAAPDLGVHADGRLGIDARRLLEEPDAHLEAEVRRGQRADRTDVHRC